MAPSLLVPLLVCGQVDASEIQAALAAIWTDPSPLTRLYYEVHVKCKILVKDEGSSKWHFPATGPTEATAVVWDEWIEEHGKKGGKSIYGLHRYANGKPAVRHPVKRVFNGEANSGCTFHPESGHLVWARMPADFYRAPLDTYGDVIGQPMPLALPAYRSVAGEKLFGKEPYSLHELLPSGKYSVRTEPADGEPCVRLERPGLDRVWLAPRHGYSVVRREWHWTIGGPIKRKIYNSDFRSVTDRLALPYKSRMEYYGHPRTRPGRLCAVVELAVQKLEIDIPDSVFEPRWPKGTAVTDLIRQREYSIDYDSSGNMIETNVHDQSAPPAWYARWYVWVGIAVLSLAAAVVLARWRRG